MTSHPKIVELLKDFMDADGRPARWITVQEFRTFFHLQRRCSKVIAGYFQRIYQNRTYGGPYRVIRTEQVKDPANPYRYVKRYLVEKTPPNPKISPRGNTGIRYRIVPCER
jgi:hypothetical protein